MKVGLKAAGPTPNLIRGDSEFQSEADLHLAGDYDSRSQMNPIGSISGGCQCIEPLPFNPYLSFLFAFINLIEILFAFFNTNKV